MKSGKAKGWNMGLFGKLPTDTLQGNLCNCLANSCLGSQAPHWFLEALPSFPLPHCAMCGKEAPLSPGLTGLDTG